MDNKDLYDRVSEALQRKIYLCGNERAIQNFLNRHKEKLNIVGIVSMPYNENSEEWLALYSLLFQAECPENERDFQLPLFDFTDDTDSFRDGTIIICQNGVYSNDIEYMLDFYGYGYRQNYIFDYQAELVLDARPILILHGYICFVRDLYLIMRENAEVTEKYKMYALVYNEGGTAPYCRGINDLISSCDIYAYNKESKPYYFTERVTPANCKRICFPCVNFWGWYPQLIRKNQQFDNEYYLEINRSTPYKFGDREMNEMIRQGLAKNMIVQRVCAEDYYDAETIINNFNREMRIMRLYERDCNVKLADFFESNYKTVNLLCCSNQWTKPLAVECARQILGLIGVDVEINVLQNMESKKHSEVPVYPSVAKALGIVWAMDDAKYYVDWENGAELSTFRQYADRYCMVINKMKEIKEIW